MMGRDHLKKKFPKIKNIHVTTYIDTADKIYNLVWLHALLLYTEILLNLLFFILIEIPISTSSSQETR